jgi:two-component system, OmpR family, KDP operon response regulator KdpE
LLRVRGHTHMAQGKHLVQLVDEEPASQRVLRMLLEADGFRVVTSDNCLDGEREAASRPPDAMIVSISLGLPDHYGVGLIKAIRSWSHMPILVLSARRAAARRLALFDAGADDCILKPFSAPELLARVRVALRFHARGVLPAGVLDLDDVLIDLGRRIVCRRDGHELDLTRLEYRVLETLVRGCNRAVTRAKIMTEVWGPNAVSSVDLRVFIFNLRKKLEVNPSCPSRIITEPGVGYRLVM